MSTVKANTILPDDPAQDITLGASGDTVSVAGNDLRVNTVKDKGGNTLWTSDGSGNVSSVNAGLKGNLVLISTGVASGTSSIEFTGLDSTYDVHIVKFINCNPTGSNGANLSFDGSTDNGSSYGVTATTTMFSAYHSEDGVYSGLAYDSGQDLAQSTSPIALGFSLSNTADDNTSGELHLFGLSSTTYVKHFYAVCNGVKTSYTSNFFAAGYFNTTSAIDAIRFRVDGLANFDGTFKLYGLL